MPQIEQAELPFAAGDRAEFVRYFMICAAVFKAVKPEELFLVANQEFDEIRDTIGLRPPACPLSDITAKLDDDTILICQFAEDFSSMPAVICLETPEATTNLIEKLQKLLVSQQAAKNTVV